MFYYLFDNLLNLNIKYFWLSVICRFFQFLLMWSSLRAYISLTTYALGIALGNLFIGIIWNLTEIYLLTEWSVFPLGTEGHYQSEISVWKQLLPDLFTSGTFLPSGYSPLVSHFDVRKISYSTSQLVQSLGYCCALHWWRTSTLKFQVSGLANTHWAKTPSADYWPFQFLPFS